MASSGKVQREIKKTKRCSFVKKKRKEMSAKLVSLVKEKNLSNPEDQSRFMVAIMKIMKSLQKDRGSSYIRVRNRCSMTGRPRGYIRMFGLCRNMVRHLASQGRLNGVVKKSHS